MKRASPETMSVEDLVLRYAEISVAQDDAIFHGDNRRFRRLFKEMKEIEQELKRRPGDQRRTLLPLYEYPNMQARLNAANATLAVAPVAARRMLITISESGWLPQSADAGMAIRCLDRGLFKPE
jgi:hypothetical protein